MGGGKKIFYSGWHCPEFRQVPSGELLSGNAQLMAGDGAASAPSPGSMASEALLANPGGAL